MMNLLENVLMKTELKLLFSYYIKPISRRYKKFYKYVGENFKSPNSAKGQIKVAFVVQIDGTLKDFKIIEGLNSDMNVEALRVLFNSPLWIPEKWMVKQLVLNLVFHLLIN
jgi:hypothetical protein